MKRFWDKVDIKGEDECWEWQASCFWDGYGAFRYHYAMQRAHRVAWELTFGPVPRDFFKQELFILHKCDNRKCVNPKHLFPGDAIDNMRDAERKGRVPH